MKYAWLTDIHLNFLKPERRLSFYQSLIETDVDGLLITGDIAEAPSIKDILLEMVGKVKKPIYYVLGNHDYYRDKIEFVQNEMFALTKTNDLLYWLPASGIQKITDDTVLLGQDGWADGRYGDYANSRVGLNDSLMIADLYQEKIVSRNHLLNKMQQLADKDAKQLQSDLINAVEHHPKKIIVLTHVPPFKEASMHQGMMSTVDYLPFFSSKATGDVLLKVAKENTQIDFVVLCGHTHSSAHYQALPNMLVKAGSAEYFKPMVQDIISL